MMDCMCCCEMLAAFYQVPNVLFMCASSRVLQH
jgi:hypothetical protein